MITARASRAYHAIVRALEKLDDAERQDVWNRLSTAYAPNRTDVTGKPLAPIPPMPDPHRDVTPLDGQ